ncbi:MAG: endonuclease V [Candidatus Nezhaarchaeales archaeon]
MSKARALQRLIASRRIEEDDFQTPVEFVTGVDVAYSGNIAAGVAVVLKLGSFEVVEVKVHIDKVRFPYMPTLLSFREFPVIRGALMKLNSRPSITFVNGQGVAHPYRCGLATYLGVMMNMATIGVTKSKLCGKVGDYQGDIAPLVDGGEVVGVALLPPGSLKPIYVSVGNKVSLNTAVTLVKKALKPGSRMPEPVRQADLLAKRSLAKLASEGRVKHEAIKDAPPHILLSY